MTLVELMVALVLGLLIVLAAVAALIVARQGFTSVDSSTQLRENVRFAASVLQRVSIEAGFENAAYGDFPGAKEPGVRGFDNAVVGALVGLPGSLAHDSRNGGCGGVADTSCVNGSDVLVVRYWGVSRNGVADGSMVNCAGIPEPRAAERAFSIFHIVRSAEGEPTLACTYRDPLNPLTFVTVPLVQGVEGFQVLYGVDGVTPGSVSGAVTAADDTIADRYLRAADLDAGGAYVANNWARVRSLRIGLLVRGAAGSAVERTAHTYDVLGAGFTSSADTRSSLAAPADGRLRQTLVFTVHLRNAQFP